MNQFENFTLQSVPKIFAGLACYAVRFASIIFVVWMVYTGIRFLLSRGDPTAYGEAKKMFFYSLVGGLVIYGVYTIILTISLLVAGSTNLPWVPLSCS